MNLVELDQVLRKLRLSGMADVLETRLLQAQTEPMAPIDLLAALVTDELQRREDRLLARRHKQARSSELDRRRRSARRRPPDLPARYGQEPDCPGHRPRRDLQQGYRVIYREAHTFLEELAEATLADTRTAYLAELIRVPLLIIDDLRHAQAATYRRRGPARADHAPRSSRATASSTANHAVGRSHASRAPTRCCRSR